MTKSSDCKSDLVKRHASRPCKSTGGKHYLNSSVLSPLLLLIRLRGPISFHAAVQAVHATALDQRVWSHYITLRRRCQPFSIRITTSCYCYCCCCYYY